MTISVGPTRLPAVARRALRIMLVAKHVHWDGGMHPTDGNHAPYHREMRQALEGLGVNLTLADSYEALFERPEVDFVFPLLNRGGFLNSEMLLPLLCQRFGLPFVGASAILRGLSDDKHLAKQAAAARGLPTAPWAVFRRGAPVDVSSCPPGRRFVIKPNASSASWGISAADDREGMRAAVQGLHAEGHDAIVEPFITGHDIEVPVITSGGAPLIMPSYMFEQHDPDLLRTYGEKRSLTAGQGYTIRLLDDGNVRATVEAYTRRLIPEYWPFDYGRFEFRMNAETGEIAFLEVNMNCNLWSKKIIGLAATRLGWSHGDLIETILAESLRRQGLVDRALDLAA